MRSVLDEAREANQVQEWKRERGDAIARVAAGSMRGDPRAAEGSFKRVWRWLRGRR